MAFVNYLNVFNYVAIAIAFVCYCSYKAMDKVGETEVVRLKKRLSKDKCHLDKSEDK